MKSLTMAMPHNLKIDSLGEFADKLIEAFTSRQALRVDLSSVPTFDVSITQLVIQLMAASRRHALAIGIDFSLVGPLPPPFASVLERSGFMTGTPDDIAFWQGDIQS